MKEELGKLRLGQQEKPTAPSRDNKPKDSTTPLNPEKELVPRRHKFDDLARLIVRNAQKRRSELTSLQQRALRDFRNVGIVSNSTSTSQLIRTYEPIFDKLFFLESLEGKLDITATGDPADQGSYIEDGNAVTAKVGAKIEINTQRDRGQYRILTHIATLIHEMIHAFLSVYMLDKYRYETDSFNGIGYTGHGGYLQDMAYTIDKAIQSLMGLTLDLGRECAIWQEMQEASGERIDASKWGMSVQKHQRAPAKKLYPYQINIQGVRQNVVRWPPYQGY
ncbi:hypothetical protein N431DRAFT_352501 [Stipitochalara longipes BDJ]|nr:hypothetical protein N431DRAFT_352501 [Stipitochalara longipes BDJ]